MKLTNGRMTEIRAVCCQLKKEPIKCTKNMPKACENEIVVKNAPRFLGLVYSPTRADRRVARIPPERPWNALATIISCK